MRRSTAQQGEIVNLTDRRAGPRVRGSSNFWALSGRTASCASWRRSDGKSAAPKPLLPHLVMPAHHDVRPSDVLRRRLHGTLAAAAERGPADFPICC